MKVTKRILSLLLVCVMLFALAACNDPQDGTTGSTAPTGGNVSSDKGTYTVKLSTAGGMALAGYQVMIYDDPACGNANIVDAGTTDENGNVKFSLKKGGKYYIQLDAAKLKGYDLKDYYEFNGTTAEVVLTSSLIQGESVTANVFQLGDVMYDFSFTDTEGNEVKLSEVLAQKDMVMLNFWYVDCSACQLEFPVLQQAYEGFAENIEILGLNSFPDDGESAVASFKENFQLTFPMGKVEENFNPQSFIDPVTSAPCGGYPTSIFIDRYGVICLIEVGAMTSLTEWNSVFAHFVGDEYEQTLVKTPDELITRLEPTVDNPPVENIDAAFTGQDDLQVQYRWEEEDIYSWPFLVGEKEGETCIYASNSNIYESYSILYADVTMEKGDVLAFDYWASSEKNYDVLYVIVNDEPVYTLSGLNEGWNSAYCWIADAAGTYELALCYQKDTDGDEGEDNVYLKNLRIVTIEDIDSPSYLPRQAANKNEDGSITAVDIVLNEQDGYYHIGTADGPLLLAGLYDYTQFSEEEYIYLWADKGEIIIDGEDGYAALVEYFSAATNSNLVGWCTVTEELAEYLKIVADIKGYLGDENEWLLFCKYFDAYGTNGQQLEDPVAGLKKWSALTAVEGVDVETNHLYYNGNPIMPRGKLSRFTPTRSGAYRITSSTNYTDSLDAWIFVDEVDGPIYEYQHDEMMSHLYCDSDNVTIVMYMEAGKNYYIDIAPYDVYAVCDVWFDIEFLGESYELFRSASPSGAFTTVDPNMGMGEEGLISIGIDVVLNPEDGYYHEDLGKDENGNQIYGSIVYAYFTGSTPLFGDPIADVPLLNEDGTPKLDENGEPMYVKGMINKGGFDFSMDDDDEQIMHYWKLNNYDNVATLEYMSGLMLDYDVEKILDVFEGIYHGPAGDLTAEMQAYLDDMITDSEHPELNGCVPVDARLAELLQMLVDKYSFKDVENAWLKLCFYYDELG